MTRFECTIPGNPIPWGRTEGSGKRRYKAERTRTYQETVGWYARQVWKGDPLKVTLKLGMTLRFYRETAQWCDLDRLENNIMDALEGIVYENDVQIWAKHSEKAIDRENPRVEILVEVL